MSWLPEQERQEEIEKEVLNLSSNLGLSYPDNSLKDFIDGMGIEVFNVDFQDNTSGVIFFPEFEEDKKLKKQKPKIFLNANDSVVRRTFSLAHEIGHYVLHKNEKVAYRVDRYSYEKDDKEAMQETEANFFAATLLMPKVRFVSLLESGYSLDMLADYFAVSRLAIENRLVCLEK